MYSNDIIGWMNPNELDIISRMAKIVPPGGTILEIGSMFGRSSVAWAESCDPSVKVYCGDRFPDSVTHDCFFGVNSTHPVTGFEYNGWKEFLKNTADFPNIIPMRGTMPIDSTYPGDPVDIFFLDSGHTNPGDWDIIKFFAKFVKPNGIILGHDYSFEYSDVKVNAHRLSTIYNSPLLLYPNSSLWSIVVTAKYEDIHKSVWGTNESS